LPKLRGLRLPGYISRLTIALGEHAELETQALVAERLGYLMPPAMRSFSELSKEVGALTHGLKRSLQTELERERNKRSSDPNP